MPKEIPGFYYDAEKNRYFPYKGPIPGSSFKPPAKPPAGVPKQDDRTCERKTRRNNLLQVRELFGNIITSKKGKFNFQAECQKSHASQPWVWRYKATEDMGNIALQHALVDVITPHGLVSHDILLSGGLNGFLCFFRVGKAGQDFDSIQRYNTECVWPWPVNLDKVARHKGLLRPIGSPYPTRLRMPSDITCVKVSGKQCIQTENDARGQHLVITTLVSEGLPGSVFILDLSKPLDSDVRDPIVRDDVHEVAAFKQTLWTVDCDPEGLRAAIGTNCGAALLNMETGMSSWIYRCKSDVLSLQLDQSRNLVLCGLRNGSIVSLDTRCKQIKHGSCNLSRISMSSSVCSLKSLKLFDQYFLASSMDGSIKLYDHRLMQRGPIQSYEGNVNSHTRIELGVDPSEKVVMSGGKDCFLRLWNIKSGELLFNRKFTSSIPTAICWPRVRGNSRAPNDSRDSSCYWQEHTLGAWLGSYEGIFYMDWL